MGVTFFREFKSFFLTEPMRGSDKFFSAILSKIGDGLKLNEEEIKKIESRMFSNDEVNVLCPYGLRSFRDNKDVAQYNNTILQQEESKTYSAATDNFINCPLAELNKIQNKLIKLQVADTGGLPQDLIFVIEKSYVITTNININDGLVYGAVGTLE